MYESMMQIMRMFNGPELTVACHPLDFELINEAVESQVNAGHTRKLVEVTKSDFVRPGQVIVINNRKMNEPIRSRITQLPRIFLDNLPDE